MYGAITTQQASGGFMYVVDFSLDSVFLSDWGSLENNATLRPVCSLAPRQMFYVDPDEYYAALSTPLNTSTDNWLLPAYGSFGRTAAKVGTIVSFALTYNAWHQTAEANGLLAVAGGVPGYYDGTQLYEIGFLETPTITSSTATSSGGSFTAGTYTWMRIQEWLDAQGNVSRSEPSVQLTKSGFVASGYATLVVPNIGITLRQDVANTYKPPIIHRMYRNVGQGSTFYATAVTYGTTHQNAPKTATNSIVDSAADTTIAAYASAYADGVTDGLELPDMAPPSATLVISHKRRLWLAGTPDDTIYYSKPFVKGVAPGFNDTLTIAAFEGGRVKALGTLDETLIVFKANSIYAFFGEPYDANGKSSTLSEPRRISSDVGCSEPRSVVITPDGLMFLSQRGIFLLDRSMQLQFVGDPVSDKTGASGAGITSAVLVPGQSLVRFTRSMSTSATYDTLVWDYERKAWSVDKYYCTVQSAQRGAVSAAMVNGTYTWVTPEGQEYEEDTSTYLDAGTTWVTLKFRTSYMKPGSIQGYQRIWHTGVLGERKSAAGLAVVLKFNYGEATQTTASFSESATNVTPMQVDVGAYTRPRCSAVQVEVYDTAPAVYGTGQGITFQSVVLDLGVFQGKKNRSFLLAQKG